MAKDGGGKRSAQGDENDRNRSRPAPPAPGRETGAGTEEAAGWLARVLDRSGRVDEPAFSAVEAELVARGSWSRLAHLYGAAAKRAPDSEIGRSLWLSAGLLHIEKLDDRKGGERWLRRVLGSDPGNPDAKAALVHLLEQDGRTEAAVVVLERALAAVPPEEKAAIAIEIADRAEPERGLAAIRAALEAGAGLDALAAARALLLAEGRVGEAASVLERELEAVLGPDLAKAGDPAEDPEIDVADADPARVEAVARAHRELAASLLGRPVHHDLARTLWGRARALGDEGALAGLDALEAKAHAWRAEAEAARDRGLGARDRSEAAEAYLDAAELYLVYGQDRLRADEHLGRALLLQPAHERALGILEAIEARPEDRLKRLDAMIEGVKAPEAKVRLLLERARVAAGMEEEEAGAIRLDALSRAHALAPGERRVAGPLAALLLELGKHQARAEVLEHFLAATRDPDLALETHLELGKAAAVELGDAARARRHFEAVLAVAPDDLEAVSALCALYKDAGDGPRHLSALSSLADLAPDYERRRDLLAERVERSSGLGSRERFAAAVALFEHDPDAPGLEEEVAGLAEETGEVDAWADALVAAASVRQGPRAAELWRQAARRFEGRLPGSPRAAHAYRRVLEHAPKDREAQDAIERYLRAEDDPRALAEALAARVRATEDRAERRLARARLAELLDRRLDQTESAVEALEANLAEDPDDEPTLVAVEELYARLERWSLLEPVLARLARLAPDEARRAELGARRAEALERLDQGAEAAEQWLELLPSVPDRVLEPLEALMARGIEVPRIAAALEPIYAARGDPRRRDVLALLASEAPEPAARRAAAREGAKLSARLGDPELGLEFLLRAFAEAPEDRELHAALLEVAPSTSRAAEVVDALVRASAGRAGPTAAALLGSAAVLAETALGDLDRAVDEHRRALDAEPASAASLAALERLLGAKGRYAELAAVYEAQRRRAANVQDRLQLGLKFAELREERLGDRQGAIDAYQAVLVEHPEEPTALARLATRLSEDEAPKALLSVLDRLRGLAPNPAAAAALDVRSADVLRRQLGDAKGAVERYVRALAAGPAPEALAGLDALIEHPEVGPDAASALEGPYAAAGDAAGELRAVLAQAPRDQDAGARERRAVRAARLAAEQLGDKARAFELLFFCFERGELDPVHHATLGALADAAGETARLAASVERRASAEPELWRFFARIADADPSRVSDARRGFEAVLALTPRDPEALDALERLTAAGDDPVALARVLESRADAAAEGLDRAPYLRRAALVWEEAADQPEAALSALSRARVADPNSPGIYADIARLSGRLGRFAEQAEALREEAARTEAPVSRARVLGAEARARVAAGDHAGAVRALELSLESSPDQREAREALESLLDGPAAVLAATALEPVYRRAGDWGRLAGAYRVLAERSTDPRERVERWVAIRSIEEERLGRLEPAWEAAERAFAEAPDRLDLFATLERLADRCGRSAEVASRAMAAASRVAEGPRAALVAEAARLADHHGDAAMAAEAWAALAELRPEEEAVWAALAARRAAIDDASGQIDALVRWAELGAPLAARRAEAGKAAERASDRRAAGLYRAALEADPGYGPALEGLRRTEFDPAVKAAALFRAIPALEAGRVEALLELGRLQLGPLEQPSAALDSFAAALAEADPPDAALAALLLLLSEVRGQQPDLVTRAATLVEPVLRERGEFAELIQVLEARSEVAPAAERGQVRREIAEVYERSLGRPEMGFLTLGRAFLEAPTDAALADEAERLAHRAGALEEWAELLEEALGASRTAPSRLPLAQRAARLAHETMQRPSAAIPHYETVLELSPGDGEALDGLESIFRKSGDAGRLVVVLQKRLAVVPPEDSGGLWAEIADLAEHDLRDVDLAAEALGALRRLDPADPDVLRRLVALGARADRPRLAVDALEAELAVAAGADERAGLLLQIAQLKRDRLADPAGAVANYAAALAHRPDDPGAIAGLAAVLRGPAQEPVLAAAAAALAPTYLRHGAFEAYLDCLERVAVGGAPEERLEALIQIAETWEVRLGRPERAFAAARRALALAPRDDGLWSRIERIASDHRMDEDLAALLLDEADASSDPRRALGLRRRVAAVYDKRLQDLPRAVAEYERVLEVAPGDAESLAALERLYSAVGRFDRLAEVYRRRIAQAESEEERAGLLRAFAALQEGPLEDRPGAIATLRRLAQLVPEDSLALEALGRLLEAEQRFTEVADVLERRLNLGGEPAERLDWMARLGRVKAEALGDLAAADRLLGEVLSIDPRHPAAREYLEERFQDAVVAEDLGLVRTTGEMLSRALEAAGEPEALVSVLELRAGLEPRGSERVPLELKAARWLDEGLFAPERAFELLTRVVRRNPGFPGVIEATEELAQRLGRSSDLVPLYEAALEEAPDAELRERLRLRVAELLEGGNPSGAVDAWRRVLAERPDDPQALAALDRLETSLERWAALTEVLERRAELAPEGEKHPLWLRLAALWEERLGEPAEALFHLRRAREEAPDDRSTLEGLARLLDPDEHGAELAGVLDALAERTSDPRARRRLEGRLAALTAGPLDDPDRAVARWRAILDRDPRDPEAERALEALYERTGRWAELAVLLESGLDRVSDEQEVLRLQRKLGFVRGARLGSVDEAVAAWQDILRRNPNDIEALEALRRVHRDAGQWEELVLVLRKLIPLQPDAAGVKAVRFELAQVLEDGLGRTEDAVESARRVLDIEPHTPSELMRLEELFVTAGAHGEAVRVKTARAALAESRGEQVEIWLEVAELYERKLNRRSGSAAAYERVLDLEPGHPRAYAALAAMYEEGGDYRRLVDLHDRQLEHVEEAEGRRAILWAIVEIQERWLGHPDLAFVAACRAFSEEGADERAQALAERLARETSSWDLLAAVYAEQLEQVGAARAVELRRRLGEIHADQLADRASAERYFSQVLSARPEDDATRRRLVELWAAEGRWAEVVSLHEEEFGLSTDPARRQALLFEIARIEEQERADPDAAISAAKQALDLDSDDPMAFEGFGRLLRQNGRWSPLVDLLARRVERGGDPEQLQGWRWQLAEALERGLGDVPRAIEAYRDLLEAEPGHRPSLDALERLFTAEERWGDVIDVYERRVERAESEPEALSLLAQIAGIQEERFGDLDAAASTLLRLLEINPDHLPAVVGLERLWRASGDHERRAEALERQVELTRDPEEAASLLLELGRTAVVELEDPLLAEQALSRALERAPRRRDVLRALADLYEQRGEWAATLDLLAREAHLVGAEVEAATLHFRMGKIREDMLGEREAARESFERALEMDRSHGPSLAALRRIREAEGDHGEVIALSVQQAELVRDPVERSDLLHAAAMLALEPLDDVERAIDLLERSVTGCPDHVPSLEVLSDLLFSEERFAEAERLLLRLVRRLDSGADRGALGRIHYRLAYIAEKEGRASEALERYHTSYELDSTYLPTLEGLAGALLRVERWEDAQRVSQAILIQHKSALTDAEVVDLHFQIGDLALKLEQHDRAQKSFQRALALDASHVPSLGANARLEAQLGRFEEAFDLRERLLSVLPDEEQRLLALFEQAELCERFEEPWRAIDAYAEARRMRPEDPEILRALVRLYRETSQIMKALGALSDLGSAVTDKLERRDVLMEIARLHHEQQGNVAAAVQALNAALDVDPNHVEAFSRIEQMLFESRSWDALADNYARMLRRLPKSERRRRAVLWRSLAELHVRVLRDDNGARQAYEVLWQLEPEDAGVGLALARLYARSPDAKPQAAALYLELLPRVDDPAEPARALYELSFEAGHLDRTFCALGALVLTGAASAVERQAYAGLLRYVPPRPSRPLDDATWRERVLHPYCRGPLAALAFAVYQGAPTLFQDRKKAAGLKPRRERVDFSDSRRSAPARLQFFGVVQQLLRLMPLPPVEAYLRAGSSEAARLFPGSPAALVIGRNHALLDVADPRQLGFEIGRQLAFARPELALVAALDAEDAAACIEAAIRLGVPEGSGVDLGLLPNEVARWQRDLGRAIDPKALGPIRDAAAEAVAVGAMKVFARYLKGVEHSANRAGLLLGGDVQAALVGLDGSESMAADVSSRARVRELIFFALSADHFLLRERLGATVRREAEERVRQRP